MQTGNPNRQRYFPTDALLEDGELISAAIIESQEGLFKHCASWLGNGHETFTELVQAQEERTRKRCNLRSGQSPGPPSPPL